MSILPRRNMCLGCMEFVDGLHVDELCASCADLQTSRDIAASADTYFARTVSSSKRRFRGYVRFADATWWDQHGRKLSDDPEWNKWLLECEDRDRRRLASGGCF